MNYDMIIGRDLLTEIGIDLLFSSRKILWDHKETPFKSQDADAAIDYHVIDSASVIEATDRIKLILDAKYEAANLDEVAERNEELDSHQQHQLLDILYSHKDLFDGTLGRFKGTKYNIKH